MSGLLLGVRAQLEVPGERDHLAAEVVELADRGAQRLERSLVVGADRGAEVGQPSLVPLRADELDDDVEQPALVGEAGIPLVEGV